jgi:hypothetical protein
MESSGSGEEEEIDQVEEDNVHKPISKKRDLNNPIYFKPLKHYKEKKK